MSVVLKLIRVKDWVKNLFVFLPLFFSGKFLEVDLFLKSSLAFFIFSFTASSIYILNDLKDIESDRNHPEKCNRPLASGAISKTKAFIVFFVLVAAVVVLLILFKTWYPVLAWKFTLVILSYFALNLLYTYELKHVAIIDISIIAIGFVLRVFAGGYATGILISQWAILLTFILALVLAVGKRRGELVNARLSGKTRRSLDGYNIQFADIILSISCALAIVCYLMFITSKDARDQFGNKIFYTVFFVIFAFLRYLQQTLVYNKTESPTRIIYKDRYIQGTLILWLLSFLLLIYFK